MTKTLKAILIVSLLLNITLAVGFVWFRSFVGTKLVDGWVMAAEAEQHQLQSILADLESGDPNKIDALEDRLREQIEMGEKNIALIRQVKW